MREAIVRKNMEDEKKLALALIENLQRENLNPVERALAYKKLTSDFSIIKDLSSYFMYADGGFPSVELCGRTLL